MSKEKKLIPELRFPEFIKDGEWEVNSLDKLGQFLGGGTPERSNDNYWTGNIAWISSSDISEDDIHNISITRFINEQALKESATKLIPKGSILFVSRVGVGKLAISKEDLCTSQDFTSFISEKVYNYFIGYYFIAKKQLLQSLNQGTSIKGFSKGDLEHLDLIYPKSSSEQQKIASCLSSLDEVITAHSQKLELLKEHKKGLMQNLFPQKGEKVPKYRFKKFEKDEMWVEKTIDTVKSILTDYVANGSFQSLRENLNVVDSVDYAFYVRLTDLRAGLGHSNQKYVDESTYKFLNKSALYGGELLMANIGANVGEVWQMPNVNKPATLAPNMIMIKFKKDIDSEFVYQYLTSDIGVAAISSVISGSGHPKISKTDLRQVKVILPPRIEEQQKIASCLSFLDALITAQAEKIEQLKMHKKGLMQGLFPEMND